MSVELMLDSGAFSAWKQQKDISLDAYIEFVKSHDDCVDSYVNLDVIPGAQGRSPSLEEVEQSAQKGWDNYVKMVDAGLDPIPVYHQGESMKWLDKMMDFGASYIGISPSQDRTSSQKIAWLDKAFIRICGGPKGWPSVKTHGFGVTAIPLMKRYPWYSVDSTTWFTAAAYGVILFPLPNADGTYNFFDSPDSIYISDRGEDSAGGGHNHFKYLSERGQEYIVKYLASVGSSIAGVGDDFQERARVNVTYFEKFMTLYEDRPLDIEVRGFF